LFDEAGVKRAFTVPYIEGQSMSDHIDGVAKAAGQVGGLTKNIISSAHHSGGKGFGSGEGHTVGHPADKLRATTVPKNDENAKSAIAAAMKYLNDIETVMGDKEPTVVTAKSQVSLVKPTSASGMSLFDLGALLISALFPPTQAVAKAHSGTKQGGHASHLRAPEQQGAQAAQPQGEPQGAPQGGGGAPEGTPAPSAPPAAPAPQQAAPAAPPQVA
jgi:hypothetical protein